MFENLKLKLAARWLKENQVQPRLILSASDKIYLATAKKTIKKLTYVYTLACLPDQDRPGQCKLLPTTQVSTFDNKRHAELYYNVGIKNKTLLNCICSGKEFYHAQKEKRSRSNRTKRRKNR